jgi:hypothetical protein
MKIHTLLLTLTLASAWRLPAVEIAPPIACNLKALTVEQRHQLTRLGEHVITAISGSRELMNGYAFHIDPKRATVMDVAQWLDVWRRCCPFYEFLIDFHAADGAIWLSVTGRPGVKEYIPLDSPRLATKLPMK